MIFLFFFCFLFIGYKVLSYHISDIMLIILISHLFVFLIRQLQKVLGLRFESNLAEARKDRSDLLK